MSSNRNSFHRQGTVNGSASYSGQERYHASHEQSQPPRQHTLLWFLGELVKVKYFWYALGLLALFFLILGVTHQSQAAYYAQMILGVFSIGGGAWLVRAVWYRMQLQSRELRRQDVQIDMMTAEVKNVRQIGAVTPIIAEMADANFTLNAGSINVQRRLPAGNVNNYNYGASPEDDEDEFEGDTRVVEAPTFETVVSELKENKLEVCLGISTTTGKLFKMQLLKGVHYKIVGGSGFGKSCEAAAILDMATQTNSPEHLLIALLDLEHKTSLLFENLPHVAEFTVGRKRVQCVATDADEVAQHLGYLRLELDRRAKLTPQELVYERFLLIYVEEFLSLKFEVDEKLKEQMLKDFSILAVRGRKYGMYLLACAQTDYADKDLREAKNQFKVRCAFNLHPTAARSAGFVRTDLIKQNYQDQIPGQFVLETSGCMDLMLAPDYDLNEKLNLYLPRSTSRSERSVEVRTPVQESFDPNRDEPPSEAVSSGEENGYEPYIEAVIAHKQNGWNKEDIIFKIWKAKKGGSNAYKQASRMYDYIIANHWKEGE